MARGEGLTPVRGAGCPSLGVSAQAPEVPEVPEATATSSAALVPIVAVFSNTERLALAGFWPVPGPGPPAYELGLCRLVPAASAAAVRRPPRGHLTAVTRDCPQTAR